MSRGVRWGPHRFAGLLGSRGGSKRGSRGGSREDPSPDHPGRQSPQRSGPLTRIEIARLRAQVTDLGKRLDEFEAAIARQRVALADEDSATAYLAWSGRGAEFRTWRMARAHSRAQEEALVLRQSRTREGQGRTRGARDSRNTG